MRTKIIIKKDATRVFIHILKQGGLGVASAMHFRGDGMPSQVVGFFTDPIFLVPFILQLIASRADGC
jgi:hypothetical protein